jgi:hypothetical protein
MDPIELGDRLGRWPAGRGPLPVLLAARLRQLIDEGELPPRVYQGCSGWVRRPSRTRVGAGRAI